MLDHNAEPAIREKAYLNYLYRIQNNLPGDDLLDWLNAEREQKIEDKIREEAYYHYQNYGDYPLLNWITAKNEIMYRLKFLAFYQHEANINKSPLENWIEAEKLYLEQF